ncbi:MAG: RNA-protein complex protein Nop10 [Euryarchaeota archaeon]|nr:RNA-protein complex protein Nop10 [Euryarchaeota archaeon]
MHTLIRKCKKCGIYTLKEVCPVCGARTVEALPPRFSPEDHYGKYRRMLKKEVMKWNR